MSYRKLQHPGWVLWRWLGPAALVMFFLAWGNLDAALSGTDTEGLVRFGITATLFLVLAPGYVVAVFKNYRHIQSTLQRGECLACGYDLTGTVAAGGRACPECGESIAPGVRRHLLQNVAFKDHPPT